MAHEKKRAMTKVTSIPCFRFNQKAWLRHDEAVIEDLKSCDVAYVVTGVVPDINLKMNNHMKVTVSEVLLESHLLSRGRSVHREGLLD